MVFDRAATTAGAKASRLAATKHTHPQGGNHFHRHDGDGHGTQVGGERPPYRLPDGDAQW